MAKKTVDNLDLEGAKEVIAALQAQNKALSEELAAERAKNSGKNTSDVTVVKDGKIYRILSGTNIKGTAYSKSEIAENKVVDYKGEQIGLLDLLIRIESASVELVEQLPQETEV